MTPILSILTPSVPSRLDRLQRLIDEVQRQVGDLPVEHLVLIDNKRRTIGEKRQALLDIAIGDYVAFVDDDDWIRPQYVQRILEASASNPSVITFRQLATFDGVAGEIIFGLGCANEEWAAGEARKRAAWHVCAWHRGLARQSTFPAINYGEDWAWAEPLNRKFTSDEVHVPLVLHEYHFRTNVTEAK